MAPSTLAAANATIIPVPSLSTPGDKSWKNELESIYNKIELSFVSFVEAFFLNSLWKILQQSQPDILHLNYTKC